MISQAQHLTLGAPQIAGPLTVFPLFGPEPRLRYRSLAQAAALGALVTELDEASVNDLLLGNTTDLPLLAYEGEEVIGAQQNRTFDTSVLVAAHKSARVPVSCVEQGRWEDERHGEAFTAAPHASDPSLRADKRATANRRARAGMDARSDQGEVWHAVGARLADFGVQSESSAMSDVYEDRRPQLTAIADALEAEQGQLGALAFVGGRPSALDAVSRPDVFADLLPRLAQGYALDALAAGEVEVDAFEAERFLDAALHAPRHTLPTAGMGAGVRVDGPVVVGSGLEHDDELVQLCVFPADGRSSGGRQADRSTPIVRPSRRRPTR